MTNKIILLCSLLIIFQISFAMEEDRILVKGYESSNANDIQKLPLLEGKLYQHKPRLNPSLSTEC